MKKKHITSKHLNGRLINQETWDEIKKNHPDKRPSGFIMKLLIYKKINP